MSNLCVCLYPACISLHLSTISWWNSIARSPPPFPEPRRRLNLFYYRISNTYNTWLGSSGCLSVFSVYSIQTPKCVRRVYSGLHSHNARTINGVNEPGRVIKGGRIGVNNSPSWPRAWKFIIGAHRSCGMCEMVFAHLFLVCPAGREAKTDGHWN